MLLFSIIASIFPILIYLFFLRKLDKNSSKPIKFILYHFLYGSTVAIILGIIGSEFFSVPFFYIFKEETNSLLKMIIIAPIIEEIAKASLLFKTINNKNIVNLTDGIIYGGAIGLGFGMTENFLYFTFFSNSLDTFIPLLIFRSSFTVLMHSIASAIIGGFMSFAKLSLISKSTYLIIIGLVIAMFIHFIWNLSVVYTQDIFTGF